MHDGGELAVGKSGELDLALLAGSAQASFMYSA